MENEEEYKIELEKVKETDEYKSKTKKGRKNIRRKLKVKLGLRKPDRRQLKENIKKRGYALAVLLNIKSMKGLKTEIEQITKEKEELENELLEKKQKIIY